MKKLILAATVAAIGSISVVANAQTSAPTKTAPVSGIETTWMYGLSNPDIRMIKMVTKGKSDEDRWMVWTAIVRNREASKDMYRGEALTNDKVLANVRVRMSTEESNKWTTTWSHLNNWDRQAMIRVLRDDLAQH